MQIRLGLEVIGMVLLAVNFIMNANITSGGECANIAFGGGYANVTPGGGYANITPGGKCANIPSGGKCANTTTLEEDCK
jgi:hypothetical protein